MSRSGFLSALTKRSSKSEPVDASLYYAVLCHEYPGLTLKAILEDMTEAQVYGLFQSLPEMRYPCPPRRSRAARARGPQPRAPSPNHPDTKPLCTSFTSKPVRARQGRTRVWGRRA